MQNWIKFFHSPRFDAFSRHQKGVVAIEFVFIFPLLLLMYEGLTSISTGMMISRKINLVSRAVSDLVSQQPAGTPLNDSTLDQVKNAASAILYPFDASSLELMVGEVIVYSNGGAMYARNEFSLSIGNKATNYRSGCGNLVGTSDGTGFSLGGFPANLFNVPGAYIDAFVQYKWTPGIGANLFPAGGINIKATNYMRPRQNNYITYSGSKPGKNCTGTPGLLY